MGSSSSNKDRFTLIVNNNTNSEISAEQSQGLDGATIIKIAVEQAHRRVAADVNQGAGPLTSALAARTNIRRTGT
jgi:hypothetical protein